MIERAVPSTKIVSFGCINSTIDRTVAQYSLPGCSFSEQDVVNSVSNPTNSVPDCLSELILSSRQFTSYPFTRSASLDGGLHLSFNPVPLLFSAPVPLPQAKLSKVWVRASKFDPASKYSSGHIKQITKSRGTKCL